MALDLCRNKLHCLGCTETPFMLFSKVEQTVDQGRLSKHLHMDSGNEGLDRRKKELSPQTQTGREGRQTHAPRCWPRSSHPADPRWTERPQSHHLPEISVGGNSCGWAHGRPGPQSNRGVPRSQRSSSRASQRCSWAWTQHLLPALVSLHQDIWSGKGSNFPCPAQTSFIFFP